ncbi:MAG: succinyl-diaminopimelate desuccinylase [Gammaproteobacteria bacterium]|nr:succinyl-diaminopimelate desuccinylase [Gammaproteobacteria bacterium]
MNPTLELTRDLIACASVTPADAGCLDMISARLAPLGFECVRLPANGVDNLWALRGGHGPCLAFAGHTDVVPPGPLDAWTRPPFEPRVVDGKLWGRGAADMKGSLAAMVVAVERFVTAHPSHNGRIAFMLTSDEEGPATDGTVRIVEHLREHAIKVDWCIVGEPSSDQRLGDTVRVGRRGSLNGRLTVRGVQGHVAYPDRADNPFHRALPALTELVARRWDAGNAFYPPTSFQISNVHTGTGAENVIPGTLEVLFNFRYCTEQTEAGLKAAVHTLLDSHGLDYELKWQLSGAPFLTAGGKLVEAVQKVLAAELDVRPELSTGGGTSDGRFIAPLGVEVVELGPLNASIHKIDEWVNVDELDELARVYQGILTELLGA